MTFLWKSFEENDFNSAKPTVRVANWRRPSVVRLSKYKSFHTKDPKSKQQLPELSQKNWIFFSTSFKIITSWTYQLGQLHVRKQKHNWFQNLACSFFKLGSAISPFRSFTFSKLKERAYALILLDLNVSLWDKFETALKDICSSRTILGFSVDLNYCKKINPFDADDTIFLNSMLRRPKTGFIPFGRFFGEPQLAQSQKSRPVTDTTFESLEEPQHT